MKDGIVSTWGLSREETKDSGKLSKLATSWLQAAQLLPWYQNMLTTGKLGKLSQGQRVVFVTTGRLFNFYSKDKMQHHGHHFPALEYHTSSGILFVCLLVLTAF